MHGYVRVWVRAWMHGWVRVCMGVCMDGCAHVCAHVRACALFNNGSGDGLIEVNLVLLEVVLVVSGWFCEPKKVAG